MSIDNTLNSQAANKQIGNEEFRNEQSEYDPDLPNASAVMAAICCVSSQYAVKSFNGFSHTNFRFNA